MEHLLLLFKYQLQKSGFSKVNRIILYKIKYYFLCFILYLQGNIIDAGCIIAELNL